MGDVADIERLARERLRSLRTTLGYSLDELAERTDLSPSTISRVETGKRTLGLDVLVPLANALQVSLDVLFEVDTDEDVVIRPVPHSSGTRTTWMLSRPDGRTMAAKVRFEPTRTRPRQRVHPGHDWFVVIEGRVRLWLGDRTIDPCQRVMVVQVVQRGAVVTGREGLRRLLGLGHRRMLRGPRSTHRRGWPPSGGPGVSFPPGPTPVTP